MHLLGGRRALGSYWKQKETFVKNRSFRRMPVEHFRERNLRLFAEFVRKRLFVAKSHVCREDFCVMIVRSATISKIACLKLNSCDLAVSTISIWRTRYCALYGQRVYTSFEFEAEKNCSTVLWLSEPELAKGRRSGWRRSYFCCAVSCRKNWSVLDWHLFSIWTLCSHSAAFVLLKGTLDSTEQLFTVRKMRMNCVGLKRRFFSAEEETAQSCFFRELWALCLLSGGSTAVHPFTPKLPYTCRSSFNNKFFWLSAVKK